MEIVVHAGAAMRTHLGHERTQHTSFIFSAGSVPDIEIPIARSSRASASSADGSQSLDQADAAIDATGATDAMESTALSETLFDQIITFFCTTIYLKKNTRSPSPVITRFYKLVFLTKCGAAPCTEGAVQLIRLLGYISL